ncbi:hypothetical protein WR25_26432 [Diploscapter pachys]|uniref:Activator of basal transcription 1 n=1 Tax=Diploscapter pachys TaxID=2018661 RepID=A0A2A2JLP6_9BILA|nr:hypothetical protein WR25_26432 [Diploscapter pachys]
MMGKKKKLNKKRKNLETNPEEPSRVVKKKKKQVELEIEEEKEQVVDDDPKSDQEIEEKDVDTKPETSKKSQLPSLDDDEIENPEEKQRKSGVIYFSMIPPKFNAARLRKYFEELAPGQIGRIHLMRNKFSRSIESRYKEGWMEVKKKKLAKAIAAQVDNTPIGGKSRDYVSYLLWNIRYLPSFKWVHLVEQLEYEKLVEDKRMQMEIVQARKVAAHFEEQIQKGRYLKKLEEKANKITNLYFQVREKGGEWTESAPRQPRQKKTVKRKKGDEMVDDDVMKMIFAED